MATGLAAVLSAPPPDPNLEGRPRRLTDRERKLADGLLNGLTITDAGRIAGYAHTPDAHEAAYRPIVQAYLREKASAKMLVVALRTPETLSAIMDASGATLAQRRDAALAAWDRSGLNGASDGGSSGPAIALQLVIGGQAGTVLATRLAHAPQPTVIAGEVEAQHSPPEGERQPRRAKAARDPSPASKPKRKAKAPGGRKARAAVPARPSRIARAQKSSVSPGETGDE